MRRFYALQRAVHLALLRTPLQPLWRHTGVLRYTAPRSGKAVTMPIWLLPQGPDRWIAAVGLHTRKSWWRAFRNGLDTRLRWRGREYAVHGRHLAGAERAAARSAYEAQFRSGRALPDDAPMLEFVTRGDARP